MKPWMLKTLGLVLLTVAVSALVLSGGVGQSAGKVAAQTGYCARGEPAWKCNPGLSQPKNLPTFTATPLAPAPQNPWTVNPPTIACGSAFFAADIFAQLRSDYGSVFCERIEGSHTWVIVGDGMSTTSTELPAPETPKGPIILAYTCPADSQGCLNANSQHQLSDFAAVPLIDQNFYPVQIMMSFSGPTGVYALQISDGAKVPTVLDLNNRKWYDGTKLAALMTGQALSPLPTP